MIESPGTQPGSGKEPRLRCTQAEKADRGLRPAESCRNGSEMIPRGGHVPCPDGSVCEAKRDHVVCPKWITFGPKMDDFVCPNWITLDAICDSGGCAGFDGTHHKRPILGDQVLGPSRSDLLPKSDEVCGPNRIRLVTQIGSDV